MLKSNETWNRINQLEKYEVNVENFQNQYKEELKKLIKNNNLILKYQQRFRTEKINAFTEEVDKIALRANDDRIQSINSTETYTFKMSEGLICKKEEIKCTNTIKQYKNDQLVTKHEKLNLNINWPQTVDHIYRALIIGGSGFGKINALLNLIVQHPDIDKMYLYAKDTNETKYQLLLNKYKGSELKYFNESKAFIYYSNDTGDIYENIEEYNPNKLKILIAFDIIAMFSNKKLNSKWIATELFIRGRKLNISLGFIT